VTVAKFIIKSAREREISLSLAMFQDLMPKIDHPPLHFPDIKKNGQEADLVLKSNSSKINKDSQRTGLAELTVDNILAEEDLDGEEVSSDNNTDNKGANKGEGTKESGDAKK
jgi:hypothetical protein